MLVPWRGIRSSLVGTKIKHLGLHLSSESQEPSWRPIMSQGMVEPDKGYRNWLKTETSQAKCKPNERELFAVLRYQMTVLE